jgi:hypothetical protein
MTDVIGGGNVAGRPGKKGVCPEVVDLIRRLLDLGVEVRVLAAAVGISERMVRYYRAQGVEKAA